MGNKTGISWCDSTRNFWMGCTKIGPGCDHCYAENLNRFYVGLNPLTGEANNWGPGAPRTNVVEGAVKNLLRWNANHERFMKENGHRRRVFINSHSDFFDNEVPPEWREIAWDTIRSCPNLDFLLVTKRIANARGMFPKDWSNAHGRLYRHVWLGITVVNQEEANRDIEKLLAIQARVRWLSIEPQIAEIDVRPWLSRDHLFSPLTDVMPGIKWVVCGGESGTHARPFDIQWARSLRYQCNIVKVPFFFKQAGARVVHDGESLLLQEKAGKDPTEWPDDLRVQEFPA